MLLFLPQIGVGEVLSRICPYVLYVRLTQKITRTFFMKFGQKLDYRSEKKLIGSRPSDHYFRSVCLSVCLFVCAEFFSAVFDPISIDLGHVLYVWV